jgi:DNA adenine methylase
MMEATQAVPWSRSPRPFVKWAGGKGQLLKRLEKYFPENFGTYYEPFLGGGAVFFHLVQRRKGHRFNAVLSDINDELITTYGVIKNQVDDLINQLRSHILKYRANPKNYYYTIRASEPSVDVERAARLIFLNKTCYNGLYRVNSKGKFNVPFGKYKNPKILDEENLRSVSSVLCWSNAKLLATDFQKATKDAKNGDFIYFDPPYQPISSTANFTSYTETGFSGDEQERLAKLFRALHKRGCKVLLSNSDTPEIHTLYEGFNIEVVSALRAISCKGNQRKGHTELIISSFET